MKYALLAAIVFGATSATAENARELESHEHGVGELNIAVDGKTVAMELHAPGSDIVGFEYQAESTADRAAVNAAVALLAKPLDLFVFPAAAECSVVRASAALHSEDGHDEHGEHDEDEDHAEAESSHTEFHAEYMLTCANPGALSEIEFAYFTVFENALELEVQIVTGDGALAFEVERAAPTLQLRGML